MKHFLLMALFAIPTLLNAQQNSAKYQVKGQAIDSISAEAMPYVTCSISTIDNPTQVITRFASDVNGNFTGEIKSLGKYLLTIAYVGKTSVQRTFTVDDNNRTVSLGTIKMADAGHLLKGVDVVATRPLIKAEADKITYDAQQDPEAKSATVLDLIRKLPLVTVDGQDNIQMRGTSNFKFFLNGKPTHMFDNNPGQILKGMPANMVKNIEVITQPGAKYDAEGVGGIINIVTVQKASTQGYSATVNAQTSTLGTYGGNVNLVFQTGKFNFSGNYGYNENKEYPITTTAERYSYVQNAPYPYGKQVASNKTTMPLQFGSGQLSYELDTLNLFTLSFNRNYGRPKNTQSAITQTYDNEMNQVFGYTQSSIQHTTYGSTDIGLNYQHSFKKKGEELTLSYQWSNTPNSSNYESTNTLDPAHITTPQAGLAAHSISNNKASSNEHTFQADYAYPIAKGHSIELGTKYIIRLNDSKTNETYSYFDFTGTYPFLTYDVNTLSSFNNDQDILGAYVNYTGNIGKWSLKGGVRYEYTWLKAKFDNAAENFTTHYGVLVPSVMFSYRITDMQSLKLGYDMRIQRPGIDYLNPYINTKDPNYVSYGNPQLNPEKVHNITFGYSNFTSKYSFSADLAYTFVNNSIQQYSFIKQGQVIQNITYGNIGHNKQLYLNSFGGYNGIKWLQLYANASVGYVDMKAGSYGMKNSGLTGNTHMGGTFTLPKDFRISTGAGYNLHQINLQGGRSSFSYAYTAVSKELLKKRLTISFVAIYLPQSHIYDNTKGADITTNQPSFDQRVDIHLTKTAEFRLNISYRIGSLSTQAKKTRATINNDDQKAKSGGGTGVSPM